MNKSMIIIILITLFIFFIIYQDTTFLENFNQEIDYNKIYINECLDQNPYLKFDPDIPTTSSTNNQDMASGNNNSSNGRPNIPNGSDSNSSLGTTNVNGLENLYWQISNCCTNKCITYPYCEKNHPVCKNIDC
tara:strand:- start:1904 stop:2302 length:399 start_codon:yes stop_codon:yes gene_type:complete